MSAPVLPLRSALARGPLPLDGGLSNQLEAQGCDLADELWSARLLADDPGQVAAAHAAYARAGARVLTTASYQASFEGFARRGLDRAAAAALFRRSVALARTAGGLATWVAASVGPYGAVLADGSEYRGRYGLSVRELTAFHRPRIAALAEAEPDVLALETVPDVDEAEALLRAAEGTGLPVWLSYTVEGGRTRAGQPLAEAFAVAAGRDEVVAVGVNCCTAAEVSGAARVASRVTGKPVVAYPNSGEAWDARRGRWHGQVTFPPPSAPLRTAAPDGRDLPDRPDRPGPPRPPVASAAAGRPGPPPALPGLLADWLSQGVRLVGGCCRVPPAAVARIAAQLPSAGRG